ncbi:MAG: ABC transporter ATP-binding protein [Methyloligellaceae bacterium]
MLEVKGLTVGYDQVLAVDDLDLRVAEGEIAALVGPNGAGKTSTMMAISGVVPAGPGEISFDGDRIDQLPSHEIYARGIVQVPEGRLIFGDLTVRENLLLGADVLGDRKRADRDMAQVLELFPMLEARLDEPANVLSGGQLQMLAIARGLMGRPKLFMLDEPSLGLAPKVIEDVFAMIGRLNEMGMTILLVEQNVRQALEIADHAFLLEAGRLVEAGPARTLLESDRIIESYLGGGRTASNGTAGGQSHQEKTP